ncbi:PREDICTED: THO complex subunit 4B [Camelina sativa]|uniref:THO complex subunit 4B n=1 Tax=Camelina sativa TaxID=90675 RepID=A0ABM0V7F2_CAMSA|nr:PREDICTED: THO complex subunit 4B [Camelina sativa]
MSGGLDMSLDDIIKSNRKPTGSRGRGGVGGNSSGARGGFNGGSGSNSGPSRRFANRVGNRTAPYSRPTIQQQAQDAMWQNDVFATDASVAAAFGHQAAPIVGGSSFETGTKLYISNLDYGVSNEDIKELFSEVGDLKRYGIHYDRSGRSKGTAEVVFSRRGDALAAVKRYNNVQLDGKLMKVEIVGTNLSAPTLPPMLAPAQIPFPTNGILGNFNENFNGNFNGNFSGNFRGRGRGGFVGRPRGGFGGGNFRGGRGARGRGGRGNGRVRDENVSAEDLDAELDKYHKEAMETS